MTTLVSDIPLSSTFDGADLQNDLNNDAKEEISTRTKDEIKTEAEDTLKNENPDLEESSSNSTLGSGTSTETFRCLTCQKDFPDKEEFYEHLLDHVTLPRILLSRVKNPPIDGPARSFARKHTFPQKGSSLKLTLKTSNNNFKIIKSPEEAEGSQKDDTIPRVPKLRILLPEQLPGALEGPGRNVGSPKARITELSESGLDTVSNEENDTKQRSTMVELHSLPSESQSPSFPGQSPAPPEVGGTGEHSSFWSSSESHQPTEDPLQLTDGGEKEAETHNNLLQNFLNDTIDTSPKDSGISSNETEYISLERLGGPQCPVCRERCVDQPSLDIHQKAMGHYLNTLMPYGQHSSLQPSPLDSLANLPMQQLAQQVNRLQQGQVHQQNVLINIQQFGQSMPPMPPQYRQPEMPSHYPPPPQQQQQQQQHHYPPPPQPPSQPSHMYGMQPPYHPAGHHMYYPTNSGMYPPMSQASQHTPAVSHAYQQHPGAARGMMPPPQQRMAPPQQRMAPPQQRMAPPPRPQPRVRGPMHPRPRGPRAPMLRPPNNHPGQPNQLRPMRRIAPQPDAHGKKKQRLDVLIPDTNDNDDCHVISMQKCNNGLPIINNVQGASIHPEADPVVHLTDSITLSVRNPKEVPVVQTKKSNDAKAVANILATRGITVTPAAKGQKEAPETRKASPPAPPVPINLGSAVSIIPTARNAQQTKTSNGPDRPSRPPTVDLTDDEPVKHSQQNNKRALPHQCDLCPAQYPTLQSLMNHRRTYHKTGPQNELGVPIVDLKQPAVLSKLAALGIQHYIPLPQLAAGSSGFALPIISVNAAKNPNVCNIGALGSGAVLPLGPLRHISNVPNAK